MTETVGVLILNHVGEVLLSMRLGGAFAGTYAPPAGHVEAGEDPIEAAYRELEEETGLVECDLTYIGTFQYLQYNVHTFVGYTSSQIYDTEPDKSGPWGWYSVDYPGVELSGPSYASLEMLRNYGGGP